MSNYQLIKNTEWKEVEINGEDKEIPSDWEVSKLKNLIENYVQKTKNKNFKFDESINSSILLSFTIDKIISLIRGFRFLDSKHLSKKIFLGKNFL